jgi:hypothetical protein
MSVEAIDMSLSHVEIISFLRYEMLPYEFNWLIGHCPEQISISPRRQAE